MSPQTNVTHAILNTYALSLDAANDPGLIIVLRFATGISFLAPAMAFASGWPRPSNACMYHFNEPNPWDGPFKGEATQFLDVAF